jgi:RND family efflux transporter MFP subunit
MERNNGCRRFYRRNTKQLGILALGLALLSGCSAVDVFKSDKAKEPVVDSVQQLKNVDATKITKNQIADLPEVLADIVPSVSLDITAETGGSVKQILKHRGDTVQMGDILLKLSSTDAQYQREQAYLSVKTEQEALALTRGNNKRTLAQATQQVRNLTKNYNKLNNDYDEGLATKAELDQAQVLLNDAKMALAQVKASRSTDMEVQLRQAQSYLQQAEQALLGLEVKAPISGVLTDLLVEPGMSFGDNTKVAVIQKLDPIKMTAQISPEEAKLVNGKKELTYYIPGTTTKGKGNLNYLAHIVDSETDLYELDLGVSNNKLNLKPGMKVKIQLEEKHDLMVVTVPTYSIVREGANAYVFVLVNDVVHKRSVQLGRLDEPNQEVISGIKEGEMVIISGQNNLIDGEKVQLVSVQAEQK